MRFVLNKGSSISKNIINNKNSIINYNDSINNRNIISSLICSYRSYSNTCTNYSAISNDTSVITIKNNDSINTIDSTNAILRTPSNDYDVYNEISNIVKNESDHLMKLKKISKLVISLNEGHFIKFINSFCTNTTPTTPTTATTPTSPTTTTTPTITTTSAVRPKKHFTSDIQRSYIFQSIIDSLIYRKSDKILTILNISLDNITLARMIGAKTLLRICIQYNDKYKDKIPNSIDTFAKYLSEWLKKNKESDDEDMRLKLLTKNTLDTIIKEKIDIIHLTTLLLKNIDNDSSSSIVNKGNSNSSNNSSSDSKRNPLKGDIVLQLFNYLITNDMSDRAASLIDSIKRNQLLKLQDMTNASFHSVIITCLTHGKSDTTAATNVATTNATTKANTTITKANTTATTNGTTRNSNQIQSNKKKNNNILEKELISFSSLYDGNSKQDIVMRAKTLILLREYDHHDVIMKFHKLFKSKGLLLGTRSYNSIIPAYIHMNKDIDFINELLDEMVSEKHHVDSNANDTTTITNDNDSGKQFYGPNIETYLFVTRCFSKRATLSSSSSSSVAAATVSDDNTTALPKLLKIIDRYYHY